MSFSSLAASASGVPVSGVPAGPPLNPTTGLPSLVDRRTVPQEAVMLDYYDVCAKHLDHEAKTNTHTDYIAIGERDRKTIRHQNDKTILGSVASNVEALASVGVQPDLARELKEANCAYLLDPIIEDKLPVGPDTLLPELQAEIKNQGFDGHNYTQTEKRKCAKSLDYLTGPIVRKYQHENAYSKVRRWHNEQKAKVATLQNSVSAWEDEIAELQAKVQNGNETIKSTMTHATSVMKAADGIKYNTMTPLAKISTKRGREKVIGLNCSTANGTRDGYLEVMGLDKDSQASEVRLAKVCKALVHTAGGNRLAMDLTAAQRLQGGGVVKMTDEDIQKTLDALQAEKDRRSAAANTEMAEA